MDKIYTVLTLVVEENGLQVPFYTQLPFILYTFQAFNRYIKFHQIGTFNVKFQYHWFTKLKILISVALAVITLYRVFQLRSAFNTIPFLMISHQFICWVSYTPMLSFDQKRALYHDWNFLKSFHFFHIITLTFQIIDHFINHPPFYSDIVQLVEYVFAISLLVIVFQYKRDYFFMSKSLNRKLTSPFLSSTKQLNYYHDHDDDDEFSPVKKEQKYILTAKATTFKVKDEKIFFQVFTFINRDMFKKQLKTLEDFQTIGIKISLKRKQSQHSRESSLGDLNDIMDELNEKIDNVLKNQRLNEKILEFFKVPQSYQNEVFSSHLERRRIQEELKFNDKQKKKIINALKFLFTEKIFPIEKIEDNQVDDIKVFLGQDQDIIEIDQVKFYRSFPQQDKLVTLERVLNDIQEFQKYSHVLNSLKIKEYYFDLQQILAMNVSDIRDAIQVFVIEEVQNPSLTPSGQDRKWYKVKIKVKKGDFQINKSYLLSLKQTQIESIMAKYKNNFSTASQMFQEIQSHPVKYLQNFDIRQMLDLNNNSQLIVDQDEEVDFEKSRASSTIGDNLFQFDQDSNVQFIETKNTKVTDSQILSKYFYIPPEINL